MILFISSFIFYFKLLFRFSLKSYQLVGLNWLVMLHRNNLNGILADQMGLGKTVQTLAFVGYLLENGQKGTTLIVCPCSTMGNYIYYSTMGYLVFIKNFCVILLIKQFANVEIKNVVLKYFYCKLFF